MATAPDTRLREGASAHPGPTAPRAVRHPTPAGATIAITVALGVACFVLIAGTVELLAHPSGSVPTKQRAETALFLAGIGLILPLACAFVPRLTDVVAERRGVRALSLLAAGLIATLAGALLVARVLPGRGEPAALVAVGVWSVGAALTLARAVRPASGRRPEPAESTAQIAWALAGTLVLATVVAFATLRSISPLPLAIGLVAVPLVVLAAARWRPRALSRRPGLALEAAVVLLLLLAVPDVVIFEPSHAGFLANPTAVAQFHHDFVLGPVNRVLHGDAVLVGTASQYGVANLYFIAAWFQLVPIGYGMFGLLDGALFACFFVAGYLVLRAAGSGRLLAAAALALAVVVLILNLVYPVGSLPAQHGPLRFGLPMGVLLGAILEERGRARTAALGLQLAVIGLASVWSLEAFTYTAVTLTAIVAYRAWTEPELGGLRFAARRALLAAAACLAVHLIFVVATLAFSGELPDYGWYLAYLNSFLFGEVGQITYDFSRWSPALLVGVGYAASAAAVVVLARRRPDLAARERVTMLALAGTTAYGIALFSYFVDRSADHILPYVCLPAVLAGTLWLSLILRGAAGGPARAHLATLGGVLLLAVLVTSIAWSSVGDRLPHTALAHVVPGGEGLRTALHRLKHPNPIDPRSPRGELLLARFMPGQERVLTVVSPDLETEIFLHSARVNRFPLDYPPEDSFVSSDYVERLRPVLAKLRPGDRLLTQASGLRAFARLRAQPSADPLSSPLARDLAPLQLWILQQVGRRFDLDVIYRDAQGYVVTKLAPRR